MTKADVIPLKKEADFKLEGSKQIKSLTDKYLAIVEKKAGLKLIEAEEDFDFVLFQKLYVCSLLDSCPGCDVAMSNPGGFRDSIRKGSVKKSDIISMLPFNNRIVLTEINGKNLIHNLKLAEESYCGVQKTEEGWFKNGKKIDPGKSYRVVVHEYIFGGGDYFKFVDDKSESEITSRDWRAPIEKYLYKSSKQGKNIMQACQSLLEKYDR
ncbi:MAG TPA: hypothetical protein ENN58_04320 [bacterium]|nr:hypothetical protein [bacterium]